MKNDLDRLADLKASRTQTAYCGNEQCIKSVSEILQRAEAALGNDPDNLALTLVRDLAAVVNLHMLENQTYDDEANEA